MSTAPTKSARTPAVKADTPAPSSGTNPAVLLAGGAAIGVVIGLLLPRIDREREALDPLGKKLAERATAAAKAARDTGREEIESLLPGRDAAKDKVSALFGTIIGAAKEATTTKA